MNISVKEIVIQYLTKHSYDGLYNEDDCGCLLNDFMPCESMQTGCMAGYKGPAIDGCATVGPEKLYHWAGKGTMTILLTNVIVEGDD